MAWCVQFECKYPIKEPPVCFDEFHSLCIQRFIRRNIRWLFEFGKLQRETFGSWRWSSFGRTKTCGWSCSVDGRMASDKVDVFVFVFCRWQVHWHSWTVNTHEVLRTKSFHHRLFQTRVVKSVDVERVLWESLRNHEGEGSLWSPPYSAWYFYWPIYHFQNYKKF